MLVNILFIQIYKYIIFSFFSYRNVNFYFTELGSPERFRILSAPTIANQMAEIFLNKIIRIL